MEKERIEWIDTLKFLGIFSIYLGHLGSIPNNIRSFVFSYHVPLFFLISGFFNKKIELKEYFLFIKDSFKKYMYPYYFFTLISLIYISIRNNSFSFNNFIYSITGIRNHVWGGLWFFSCLFIIKITYNLILAIFKNKFIVFIISIFLYVISMKYLPHIPRMNPKWVYNVDSAFFYIIFYSLGDILFDKFKNKFQSKYYIILYYIVYLF
ncbi:acyltransferase family protein [uncultured Fusobacterium sp.]|uniref:acyltransferase family protein n=1 Tax=uncultured Fusobacterium sp. TaxID=159267 RepID=UPI0034563D91